MWDSTDTFLPTHKVSCPFYSSSFQFSTNLDVLFFSTMKADLKQLSGIVLFSIIYNIRQLVSSFDLWVFKTLYWLHLDPRKVILCISRIFEFSQRQSVFNKFFFSFQCGLFFKNSHHISFVCACLLLFYLTSNFFFIHYL